MERHGERHPSVLPSLVVLSAAFFLGILLGRFLAGSVDGLGSEALNAYLGSYLDGLTAGTLETPTLPALIWEQFRWPLLTLCLSLTALGVAGLPILFCVRGFLLSFSVCAFARLLGGAGCALAFTLFGFSGLLAVPVLFVLGVIGWRSASHKVRRVLEGGQYKPSAEKGSHVYLCGCMAVSFLCVLLEAFVVPSLLSAAVKLL